MLASLFEEDQSCCQKLGPTRCSLGLLAVCLPGGLDALLLVLSLQDRQLILEGCCEIVPSLRHAEVVAEWAGLRPARDRVRLELENLQVSCWLLLSACSCSKLTCHILDHVMERFRFGVMGSYHTLDRCFSIAVCDSSSATLSLQHLHLIVANIYTTIWNDLNSFLALSSGRDISCCTCPGDISWWQEEDSANIP